MNEYEELRISQEAPSRSAEATAELSGVEVGANGPSATVHAMPLTATTSDPFMRAILEEALAEYDRGELKSLAILKEYHDSVGSAWSGQKLSLISACARLEHILHIAMDEELG